MRKEVLGLAILSAASAGTSCSYAPQESSVTAPNHEQSSVQSEPKIITYSEGFPPPLGTVFGTFGLRDGCLVLKPQDTESWYVAVLPPGSVFRRDPEGTPNAVVLQGKTAKFGEMFRLGGGVSPYDLGEQRRACPGPTVIIERILG